MKDRTRPRQERLDALWWIDDQISEGRTPEADLERMTDELIADA